MDLSPYEAWEKADQYLDRARPRHGNPGGKREPAKKALALLQAYWDKIEQSQPEHIVMASYQCLVRAAFWAGEYEQAKRYAGEWLTAADPEHRPRATNHNQRVGRPWDQARAIHDCNMILGQIALSDGQTNEAAQFLLAAGKFTQGDPVLSSYGPDFALPKALLEKGEREPVLQFLDDCNAFWKSGRSTGRISRLKTAIESGVTPDWAELELTIQLKPLPK